MRRAAHRAVEILSMKTLVTPDEALQIVLDNIKVLPAETLAHALVLGRTLAHDVVSEVNLPPFDNSAVDGYAVRAIDIANVTREAPMTLCVRETIAAGSTPRLEIEGGYCSRIMTGAPMPQGADTVVMREDTFEDYEFEVDIFVELPRGTSIRRAGSDVARGETVLQAGTLIGAAPWGMLASLEQEKVAVARMPRVLIITTGDELVPLGTPLLAGQIRDSNSFTLSALAQNCGAIVQIKHIGDEAKDLEKTLDEASDFDAIITSGGVSAGDFDPVRDVLKAARRSSFLENRHETGQARDVCHRGNSPAKRFPFLVCRAIRFR